MKYFIPFTFMKCEKENNFTQTLEMCCNLLKDLVNMPEFFVIGCDTAPMNPVKVCFLLQM